MTPDQVNDLLIRVDTRTEEILRRLDGVHERVRVLERAYADVQRALAQIRVVAWLGGLAAGGLVSWLANWLSRL